MGGSRETPALFLCGFRQTFGFDGLGGTLGDGPPLRLDRQQEGLRQRVRNFAP